MKKLLFLLLLIPQLLLAQEHVEFKFRYIPSLGTLAMIPSYSDGSIDFSLNLIIKDNSNRIFNSHKFNFIGGEINKTLIGVKFVDNIEFHAEEIIPLDVWVFYKIGFGSGFGFITEIQNNALFFGEYSETKITKMFTYIQHTLSIEVINENAVAGLNFIYSFSNQYKFKENRKTLSFKGLSLGISLGVFL